jgi:hypothetical protein
MKQVLLSLALFVLALLITWLIVVALLLIPQYVDSFPV